MSQSSDHLKLVSGTWQCAHCPPVASTLSCHVELRQFWRQKGSIGSLARWLLSVYSSERHRNLLWQNSRVQSSNNGGFHRKGDRLLSSTWRKCCCVWNLADFQPSSLKKIGSQFTKGRPIDNKIQGVLDLEDRTDHISDCGSYFLTSIRHLML